MAKYIGENELDHQFGGASQAQRTKELLDLGSNQEGKDQVELWDREYDTFKVIPSSTRALPSKPLLLFSEILNFGQIRTVLDAGCGIGRNATYLAQKGCRVYAVDSSPVALRELDYAARSLGVRDAIVSYNCNLGEAFPFEDEYFDLSLDSYVFCHFIDDEFRGKYRKELHRVTKPGGIVFSSVFSFEDEYYKEIQENGEGNGSLVTDPNNGITKRLYTEREIKDFFSVDFEVLYFVKFEFSDMVLGNSYHRSILALVLRK